MWEMGRRRWPRPSQHRRRSAATIPRRRNDEDRSECRPGARCLQRSFRHWSQRNHFNSPEYGPAANVRKGGDYRPQAGDVMQMRPMSNMNRLGLHRSWQRWACRSDATTPYMGGRMGDGNWNFSGYWSTNFGSASLSIVMGHDQADPLRGLPLRDIGNGLVGTRFDRWRDRNAADCLPTAGHDSRSTLDLWRYPELRRTRSCGQRPVGPQHRSAGRSIRQFLHHRAGIRQPSDDASVMVELVDITGRGGQGTLDNFLRDEAQLYR